MFPLARGPWKGSGARTGCDRGKDQAGWRGCAVAEERLAEAALGAGSLLGRGGSLVPDSCSLAMPGCSAWCWVTLLPASPLPRLPCPGPLLRGDPAPSPWCVGFCSLSVSCQWFYPMVGYVMLFYHRVEPRTGYRGARCVGGLLVSPSRQGGATPGPGASPGLGRGSVPCRGGGGRMQRGSWSACAGVGDSEVPVRKGACAWASCRGL